MQQAAGKRCLEARVSMQGARDDAGRDGLASPFVLRLSAAACGMVVAWCLCWPFLTTCICVCCPLNLDECECLGLDLKSVIVNLLDVYLVEMHQTLLVVLPYMVLQCWVIQHGVDPEALDLCTRFDPFWFRV
jgi:hypothetical protein